MLWVPKRTISMINMSKLMGKKIFTIMHNYFYQDLYMYSKTCHKRPLKKRPKLCFKTNYRLMQVKSIAECSKGEHSAILLTCIKQLWASKTFVLSIFEWSFKTGVTV